MDKLRFIISLVLALVLCLVLVGCNGDKDTNTDTGSDTQSDIADDSQIDTEQKTDMDSNKADSGTSSDDLIDIDQNSDSTTGSEQNSDSAIDSGINSGSQPDPEPDPDPEPEPPVDVTINLFENSKSDYTIVYPKDNMIIESLVKELASNIKSEYGITVPYRTVDYDKDITDKEIVVGFVRENVLYAASSMNIVNDFVLGVCDNDYVIYSSNDAMYPYAFRIFEDEILSKATNGALTITPEEKYLYGNSEYKNVTFAQYLKNKKGSYNKDLLCELFVDLSYTASDGTVLPYRMYMPSNYNKYESYPVIVFLHGAGERGNDNYSHMNNMVPNMFNQENSLIHNAIVICPQCPQGQQWVDTPWASGNYTVDNVAESNELKAVLEILDVVRSSYSTDTNRYYAMGISMGGFGTWDLLMRHSDIFAAGVPICGGADTSMAEALKEMPIYTSHAQNDSIVPYSGTKKMVDALIQAGSERIIFKSLTGGGHIIWGAIGDDAEMLKWLFEQHK